ncbi:MULTISPECIES: hypothetical protein [Haloarcula]|uniref:hypothetical protein n=1 Tax=Haloarcula TaxID=2237 RepID=UPI0023E8AC05|nr:hypothetical protein [Halomicroarcula sp. SHR3]
MPSRLSVDVLGSDTSIPVGRIARFALLALAIFAAGEVVATVVGQLLAQLRFLIVPLSEPLGRLFADGVRLLERGIRVFALLVGVGVFLSQFER